MFEHRMMIRGYHEEGIKLHSRLKLLIFKSMSFIAFFSGVYVLSKIGFSNSIYSLLWIWPFAFLIYILIVYSPGSKQKKEHCLAIHLITIAAILPRYVFYPIFVASLSHSYIGVQHFSIPQRLINETTIHGSLELIILGIFIFFIERITTQKVYKPSEDIRLRGNAIIYFVFLLIGIIVYVIVGRNLNIVQFLKISDDYSSSRISSSVYFTFVKYVISTALVITTLLIFNYSKKNYELTRKKKYVYIGLLAGIIYTFFIFGESRGTQLAVGMLMCLILLTCFEKEKKTIVLFMSVSISIVVIGISNYRGDSLIQSQLTLTTLADKLQVYFGGPASLSQPIVIFRNFELNFGQFIFDYARSIFPLNLVLKSLGSTTSQLYNISLYDGLYTHGHIIFGSSFGYIYFNVFGIPLNLCVNIFLSFKMNEVYYSSDSLEGKYISGFCMIRIIQATFSNTPTILGSVTQLIGTFGILYFISRKLNKRS